MMNKPDEQPVPEGLYPQDESNLPIEPIRLPPARRRRARRSLILPGDEERAALLRNLAQRAFPSIEFFLLSIICGFILGIGFLLDSQALVFVGILLAPLMTPWAGLVLATITGSWRFFFLTLVGLLINCLFIFATGFLVGLAARYFMPLPFIQIENYARLWWPNLFVLILGAILLLFFYARSEEKPFIPSLMLAYSLFLPLNAAGFGWATHSSTVWPNGAIVFLVQLALATLLGIVTLAILRFHPLRFHGYVLILLVSIMGLGTVISGTGITKLSLNLIAPSSAPTATTIPLPSITSTFPRTSIPMLVTPTIPTHTPSITIPPTSTPSVTPSPVPTPIYARISSPSGGGALVRTEPGRGRGVVITSLLNGTLVEIIPEQQKEVDGDVWVLIHIESGNIEGWVLQLTLATATPVPDWQPSATVTR